MESGIEDKLLTLELENTNLCWTPWNQKWWKHYG